MAHLIFLSLLVSLDGFFSGFTFRLKKIRHLSAAAAFHLALPAGDRQCGDVVRAANDGRHSPGLPPGIRLCVVFLSGLPVVCRGVKKTQIRFTHADHDDQRPGQLRSGSQPASEQPRSVVIGVGVKSGQRRAGIQLRSGWSAGGLDSAVFCACEFPVGYGRQSLPSAAVCPKN